MKKIIIILATTISLFVVAFIYLAKDNNKITNENEENYQFIQQLLQGLMLSNYDNDYREDLYLHSNIDSTNKINREYILIMEVTDISNDLKKRNQEDEQSYQSRLNKLVEINNVREAEFQIFFNNENRESPPKFPSRATKWKQYHNFKDFKIGDTIFSDNAQRWELVYRQNLKLDLQRMIYDFKRNNLDYEKSVPVYSSKISEGVTSEGKSNHIASLFFYSQKETQKIKHKDSVRNMINRRVFKALFKPLKGPGWYKLRFESRTERTLVLKTISVNEKSHIGSIAFDKKYLLKFLDYLYLKLKKYNIINHRKLNLNKPFTDYSSNSHGINKNFYNAINNAITKTESMSTQEKEELELYRKLTKYLTIGYYNFFLATNGIELFIRVVP